VCVTFTFILREEGCEKKGERRVEGKVNETGRNKFTPS